MQSTDHAQPASRPQRFVKICNGAQRPLLPTTGRARTRAATAAAGQRASGALNYKLGTVRKQGLLGASPPLGFEECTCEVPVLQQGRGLLLRQHPPTCHREVLRQIGAKPFS